MKKKFLLFYERLSREDGDDESCSITNQRRLLNRFKEEHSEFHDYQVEESGVAHYIPNKKFNLNQ